MSTRPIVLLVDDAEDVHLLFRAMLNRSGLDIELRSARDGAEALAVARSLPVDLVLSDVQMPRMTGPELIDALAAEGRDVPVVLIGASAEQTDHPGAYDVLEKNALLEALTSHLTRWLKL